MLSLLCIFILFYSSTFYFITITLCLSIKCSNSAVAPSHSNPNMISQKHNRKAPQTAFVSSAPPAYTSAASRTPAHAAEALPSYSSGAEVTPAAHTSPIVAVRLDNPHRVYDVDDILTGHVQFTPRHDCILGSVTATLAGSETSAKRANWVSQSVLQRKMRLGQHAIAPSTFPQGSIARRGFTYSFAFSIQVPLTHTGSASCTCGACGDNSKDHAPRLLPPSVGAFPDQAAVEETTGVYYFVNASVVTLLVPPEGARDHQVATDAIYTGEQAALVSIVPSYPNFPKTPAYAALPDREEAGRHPTPAKTCTASTTTEIKRGLLKSLAVGSLDLTLSEPVVLSRDASDVTYVTAQLKFSPSCVNNLCERPPKIGSIVCKLAALTHSVDPEHSSAVTTASEYVPLAQHATAKPRWVSHGSHTYTCTLAIPLTLPVAGSAATVPSFRSVYLAREYELRVSVGFASHLASLALSVPATVTASFVNRQYYNAPELAALLGHPGHASADAAAEGARQLAVTAPPLPAKAY